MIDIAKARRDAESIWRAAVAAVHPASVMRAGLHEPELWDALQSARLILVVGAGKAGAAMAEATEREIPHLLDRVQGLVNVPAESVRRLKAIQLQAARPTGSNQPTAEGVVGTEQILRLVQQTNLQDVVLCLLSGGGSALLPAPVAGITLQDKQQVTELLQACGATINEINAVRKHLSRIKGGRLAEACRAKMMFSLIISDVIGDPLDVIASGPTTPDPTTFADGLTVLEKYSLTTKVGSNVLNHLQSGAEGLSPETPKQLPGNVINRVLANNATALSAAAAKARQLGYLVQNLGDSIQGETQQVALAQAQIVRNANHNSPICLLSSGETTVTLAQDHGLGGRNQEFVLAMMRELGEGGMKDLIVFSAGTDGEDGPTDAAGAFADETTWKRAKNLGLDPNKYLQRNDAYHFFEATSDLFKPGLTETNVMDVRIILVGGRGGDLRSSA